ncbi:hypothetical protein Lisr_2262 [Legionella israelensis]|uniref:Uncharacterized protein n=1 Tax=Legionella israelensis TaxID=454 RepID=A0A0W0V6X4_9GAMM|nr:hypothetical protein Lisr_2262 [Legionella israelensis]
MRFILFIAHGNARKFFLAKFSCSDMLCFGKFNQGFEFFCVDNFPLGIMFFDIFNKGFGTFKVIIALPKEKQIKIMFRIIGQKLNHALILAVLKGTIHISCKNGSLIFGIEYRFIAINVSDKLFKIAGYFDISTRNILNALLFRKGIN